VHPSVGPDDDADDAVHKVFDTSIQALVDIRGKLSSMPISKAVDVMSGARQIAFAGIGASGLVASDACHKFFRLGIPTCAFTDAPAILQFAAIAGPGDVLVVLSHTGRWSELVPPLQEARHRGAQVIAITDPGSPLALDGALLFGVDAIEDTSVYTPMSSRLGQLALLDALHVALALARGEHAADRLRLSKQALRDM
jgi:RpiR family carbohydrate utilization transcriptional regulator